jgi:hypothetical protein
MTTCFDVVSRSRKVGFNYMLKKMNALSEQGVLCGECVKIEDCKWFYDRRVDHDDSLSKLAKAERETTVEVEDFSKWEGVCGPEVVHAYV